MSRRGQLAEARRHLEDAGRLAAEVRALVRADNRMKRGGGQTRLSKENAAAAHGAAQPPVSSTTHGSDTAGLEDVQDLIDDLEQGLRAMHAANRRGAPE